MGRTKIEWCARPGTIPESWSPVTGCTPISEGCKFCWAKHMARRLAGRYGYPKAPHHFDVTLHPDRLEQPLHWKKPRTVFVCSMGDLFHEDVPDEFIVSVFASMATGPQHVFQILTKRPERMHKFVMKYKLQLQNWHSIWLGITAENQATADERIPILLQTPAALRFVSLEPLLEPVDVSPYLPRLDWVIVGGETGPGARPMHPQWARDIKDQCQVAGIPYFHKQNGEYVLADGYNQWGTWLNGELIKPSKVCSVAHRPDLPFLPHMVRVGKKAAGHLLDGQEWHQWPEG